MPPIFLVEIDRHAIAARPRAELARRFQVIHIREVHDAERSPRNLDAAAGNYFGSERCNRLSSPALS